MQRAMAARSKVAQLRAEWNRGFDHNFPEEIRMAEFLDEQWRIRAIRHE
jgi:hypothetical protein